MKRIRLSQEFGAAVLAWLILVQPQADLRAEIQIEVGPLLDIGEQWARENLPAEWVENLDLPSEKEWQGFMNAAVRALDSGNVEDAARLMPYAETAVRIMSRMPGYEDYAAWLQQRLDYFEVAAAAVRSVPDASARPKPDETPPFPGKPVRGRVVIMPAPGAPAPAPVALPVEQKRQAVVSDLNLWKRKVANRPMPAASPQLVPKLKRIFRQEGVPEELVWIAEVESSMNSNARNPSGATGLFQLMPATAARYGLRTALPDERRHPEPSARAAARYLRFLYGEFKSWPLALAAYNAGEGRVKGIMEARRARTFDDVAPHLPIETRMYVPKVRAVISLREGKIGLDGLTSSDCFASRSSCIV